MHGLRPHLVRAELQHELGHVAQQRGAEAGVEPAQALGARELGQRARKVGVQVGLHAVADGVGGHSHHRTGHRGGRAAHRVHQERAPLQRLQARLAVCTRAGVGACVGGVRRGAAGEGRRTLVGCKVDHGHWNGAEEGGSRASVRVGDAERQQVAAADVEPWQMEHRALGCGCLFPEVQLHVIGLFDLHHVRREPQLDAGVVVLLLAMRCGAARVGGCCVVPRRAAVGQPRARGEGQNSSMRTCSLVLIVSRGCTTHCAVVRAMVPAQVCLFCTNERCR